MFSHRSLIDSCDTRGEKGRAKGPSKTLGGDAKGVERAGGGGEETDWRKTQLVGILKLGPDGHDPQTDCAGCFQLSVDLSEFESICRVGKAFERSEGRFRSERGGGGEIEK